MEVEKKEDNQEDECIINVKCKEECAQKVQQLEEIIVYQCPQCDSIY